MKPEELGQPETLHTNWGRRWRFLRGIFIDEVINSEGISEYRANIAGTPSENIGKAETLDGALQLVCYYLDSKELEAITQAELNSVVPHLDHMGLLEIHCGENSSLTVECAKCGVVVKTLYEGDEDEEEEAKGDVN